MRDVFPPNGYPTPPPHVSRNVVMLAAVSGFLAGGYWGLVLLVGLLASVLGHVSVTSHVVAVVLVGLYVYEGARARKGDLRGVRGLAALHGMGILVTGYALAGGVSPWAHVLYLVKVAIHVFGGLTATIAIRQADAYAKWAQRMGVGQAVSYERAAREGR